MYSPSDTIWNWEFGGLEPEIRQVPAIISFLGYDPIVCSTQRATAERHAGLSARGWSLLCLGEHDVLAAANGTEAVALFAARSLEIRVVVTDLSMPYLDGIAWPRWCRT